MKYFFRFETFDTWLFVFDEPDFKISWDYAEDLTDEQQKIVEEHMKQINNNYANNRKNQNAH